MQATKQQQIMGFFIEEAKEHLDTIEQGLLNLTSTMSDSEQLNELFRAAHSVKGGAAMLGFNSIQRVAHHLEDNFKILKDQAIQPDRQLEDFFLKGFDALKELVESLQSPYGYQEAQAEKIVQDAQPNFEALENYIQKLTQRDSKPAQPTVKTSAEAPALINAALKKMLQLFKQGDSPTCRQQLATLCSRMGQLSTSPQWRQVLQMAQQAIANPKNTYATLAPIVIKELKQAGDLLITAKTSEIAASKLLLQLAGSATPVANRPQTQAAPVPPVAASQPATAATPAPAGTRPQQITIPLEPRAAARALLDAFNKKQLIELAEFLMKAIQ